MPAPVPSAIAMNTPYQAGVSVVDRKKKRTLKRGYGQVKTLVEEQQRQAAQPKVIPTPTPFQAPGLNNVVAGIQALTAQQQATADATLQSAAMAASQNTKMPGNFKNEGEINLSHFTGDIPKWYSNDIATWHNITMQVDALAALKRASQMAGMAILGGGLRSHAGQVDAWNDYQNGTGAQAAKPGTGWHELGLAIDLNSNLVNNKRVVAALKKAGFVQFDRGLEPWHWSYREPH